MKSFVRRGVAFAAVLAAAGSVATVALSGESISAASPVPAGSVFVPMDSWRALDSRDGTGMTGGAAAIGGNETIEVAIEGRGNGTETVPAEAVAVVLNATYINSAGNGFITIYAAGRDLPGTSNLNKVGSGPTPNMVTSRLGDNGALAIFNQGAATDLFLDVAGYYVPGSGSAGAKGDPGEAGAKGDKGDPGESDGSRIVTCSNTDPAVTVTRTVLCPLDLTPGNLYSIDVTAMWEADVTDAEVVYDASGAAATGFATNGGPRFSSDWRQSSSSEDFSIDLNGFAPMTMAMVAPPTDAPYGELQLHVYRTRWVYDNPDCPWCGYPVETDAQVGMYKIVVKIHELVPATPNFTGGDKGL